MKSETTTCYAQRVRDLVDPQFEPLNEKPVPVGASDGTKDG